MSGDATSMKAQHSMLLHGIVRRLEREFGDDFTHETIEHYVEDSYRQLASRAKVLSHIPAFVDRFSRQRLRALVKNRGTIDDHPAVVLFVCGRNDAISQMAAALFAREAGDRAEAHSAGSAPAGELLDEAVLAMHEVDLELLGDFPKPITVEVEAAADVIVTLDAHDDIAVLDDKQYRAWNLPDLHDEGIDGYRQMRDELATRVTELAQEILPAAPLRTHRGFDNDLADLETRVATVHDLVIDIGRRVVAALMSTDGETTTLIDETEERVDQLDHEIANKVVELIALRQPVAVDLRQILVMGRVSHHLERIADYLVVVAVIADDRLPAETEAPTHLVEMAQRVLSMTVNTMQALNGRDVEAANAVIDSDDELDALHTSVFESLVAAEHKGTSRSELLAMDRISRSLERAGDHAVSIAEETLFLKTGKRNQPGGVSRPVDDA
jgi:phosphate transport system regulatory protein PhoU